MIICLEWDWLGIGNVALAHGDLIFKGGLSAMIGTIGCRSFSVLREDTMSVFWKVHALLSVMLSPSDAVDKLSSSHTRDGGNFLSGIF